MTVRRFFFLKLEKAFFLLTSKRYRYNYSNVESICRRTTIDNAIRYIHNDCRAIVHSKKYINERELVLHHDPFLV
jgi:hypothetical protein